MIFVHWWIFIVRYLLFFSNNHSILGKYQRNNSYIKYKTKHKNKTELMAIFLHPGDGQICFVCTLTSCLFCGKTHYEMTLQNFDAMLIQNESGN